MALYMKNIQLFIVALAILRQTASMTIFNHFLGGYIYYLATILTLGLMHLMKLVPVDLSFSINSASCDLNLDPTDMKVSLPL